MPSDTPATYNRPPATGADPWSPTDGTQGGYWAGGKHWTEVAGDHSVNFIQQAAQEEVPFFMYLAFNAPHDPRQSPQRFVDRYPIDSILVPANFQPSYPFADVIGCGPSLRDERLAPFPRTAEAIARHRQEYFAIITHLDEQVGRILDALNASGKGYRSWSLVRVRKPDG